MKTLEALKKDLPNRAKYGRPADVVTTKDEVYCEMFDAITEWQRETNQWQGEVIAALRRQDEEIADLKTRLHRLETKGVDE